jgi:ribose transport system permease protein
MTPETGRVKRIDGELVQAAMPPLVLVALLAGISILAPDFMSSGSLVLLLNNTAVLFILAAGVTFPILVGGIDLSIQAVASFASVLLAQLLPSLGPAAFPVAILAGAASGLISGIVHVRFRVPSFVASLATGSVVAGVALWASSGRAITIGEQSRQLTAWINGSVLGLPVNAIIAVVLGVLCYGLLRYAKLGRQVIAVGAGEPAAAAAGIDVARVKVLCFVISGAMASVAGIVLAARLSSGSPTLANQLLLPAIAAVIVGGTAITGGMGGIVRTAIGALIIATVRIGMTFAGVNIFAENIVFGGILLLAVAMTIDRSKLAIIK